MVTEEQTFLALVQAGMHRQQVDGKPVPYLRGLYKQAKGKGQRRGAGARVLPPLAGVCACPLPTESKNRGRAAPRLGAITPLLCLQPPGLAE